MPAPEHAVDDAVATRSARGVGEAELVRRAQLGSVAAFERLVVARGTQLERFLAVRMGNEGDALDVLQEALAAAWQGLPRLRNPERFWPWLCGIAEHKAVDALRKRVAVSDREPTVAASPSHGAVEIREALAALSERHRQVLLLRYLLDLSEEEVAHALGVRVGTVKSRSARARRALGELLW